MNRSAPLRRTPLARKGTKKRRKPLARCSYSPRCVRHARVTLVDGTLLCPTHATWEADRLVGDEVRARDGRCVLRDFAPDIRCVGEELFACHLIPKGRAPSVRWYLPNIVSGCAMHHATFDANPGTKFEWCRHYLGARLWDLVEELAAQSGGPSAADIIDAYDVRSSQ